MAGNTKLGIILGLALIMFCLSLFYVKNGVCCMFASNRERGFPYKVIYLSKGTDSLEEAQKVYYLSDLELLGQGWELKAGSVFGPPPLWVIPFNFIFYFIISWGLVLIFEQLRQFYAKRYKNH